MNRGEKGPQKTAKTYNSRYSLVVTHLTTNPPVSCLMSAERTGSNILMILWSYVIFTAPELLMKSYVTKIALRPHMKTEFETRSNTPLRTQPWTVTLN
jgi:hypothetical protein